MKKSDYIVRVLSTAPILAAIMIAALYLTHKEIFSSHWSFVSMLFTLGILPLFAYPMQRFIPKFKNDGRRGQRLLAMIFAVIGYILCFVMLLMLKGTRYEFFICLTYLISGIIILIINKVVKIHVSGHGCGVAGPVPVLIILGAYVTAAIYALSAIFVCISSVRSKRHTLSEFFGGAAVSTLTSVILAIFLFCIQ